MNAVRAILPEETLRAMRDQVVSSPALQRAMRNATQQAFRSFMTANSGSARSLGLRATGIDPQLVERVFGKTSAGNAQQVVGQAFSKLPEGLTARTKISAGLRVLGKVDPAIFQGTTRELQKVMLAALAPSIADMQRTAYKSLDLSAARGDWLVSPVVTKALAQNLVASFAPTASGTDHWASPSGDLTSSAAASDATAVANGVEVNAAQVLKALAAVFTVLLDVLGVLKDPRGASAAAVTSIGLIATWLLLRYAALHDDD